MSPRASRWLVIPRLDLSPRRGSRTFGSERGLVLVSVVLVLGLLGLATGGSLWMTRAELWAAGRARSERQARYTAEAGVWHAMAVLAPGAGWSAVRDREPAALSEPDEPGPLPIGAGGWAVFPGPPFGYGVEIVSAERAGLVLRSSATAVRGARHRLDATVVRARSPYAPAALVLSNGPLVLGAEALASGPRVVLLGEGRASVMTVDRAARDAVLRELGDSARVEGEVSSGLRRFDVARFAEDAGLAIQPVDQLALGLGEEGSPVALRVRGGTVGRLEGTGAFFVDGDLDVRGEVSFQGALFVSGRLQLAAAGCRLRGLVWADSVSLSGPCEIVHDAAAIREADEALRLPRLPVLAALASREPAL